MLYKTDRLVKVFEIIFISSALALFIDAIAISSWQCTELTASHEADTLRAVVDVRFTVDTTDARYSIGYVSVSWMRPDMLVPRLKIACEAEDGHQYPAARRLPYWDLIDQSGTMEQIDFVQGYGTIRFRCTRYNIYTLTSEPCPQNRTFTIKY